jgi:hypothetical protein
MGKFSDLLNADKNKSPSPSSNSSPSKDTSINQSTPLSINQSIRQSINKVMDRPRGFYIIERLNNRIDEAVRYFQDIHGIKKADRSVVVTAMLDQEDNWTNEALDKLVDRLMNELTSRLTS